MQPPELAIDFGTSNSAVAMWSQDGPRRIPIEDGADTLPTAVFFPTHDSMIMGAAATRALIDGAEGRYMRALKSVLGLPLLHEKRRIGGVRQTLADVIAAFLRALRLRAEAQTGLRFRQALSGRPVHFHSNAPAKDAQAEADLRACYLAAGFEAVRFLPEPEAAVLASHGMGTVGQTGLIVDIGGGTSDFSVFDSADGQPKILANHGVRLGGTDFDHAISMGCAMPELGLGGQLRREMGDGLLPVPRAPFVDLATWAKIPFLYSAETRRMVADMVRLAQDTTRLSRLATVLEMEVGHDLAFAVERGKIDANSDARTGRIEMAFIERGLSAAIPQDGLGSLLAQHRAEMRQAAEETLAQAGVAPTGIGRIILVGGSSLMRFVGAEMQALCPNAALLQSEAFTTVADGLAWATRQPHMAR